MIAFRWEDKQQMPVCYQYQMRQEAVTKESVPNVNLSLKDARVRPCDYRTAKEIIEKYEWMGKLAAINSHRFGIYFQSLDNPEEWVCGGVVVFGPDYAANVTKHSGNVWEKYGFSGKMLLLSRGACCYWTPKNTASRLIMQAIKQLPPEIEIITCTADALAGEVGTIYQACNFIYVGVMRHGTRNAFVMDGEVITSRTLKSRYGTYSVPRIQEMCKTGCYGQRRKGRRFQLALSFGDAVIVPIKQQAKARYFYFRKNVKCHTEAIRHLIKPYLKREPA